MQKIDSHNNFFVFTASLVVLLLVSGYVSSTEQGEDHIVLQAVVFLTELVAYFSLSLSRQWRRFIFMIIVLNASVTVLRELAGLEVNPKVGLLVSLAFYSGMTYVAARQVLFSGNIELNSIVGALAVYLLLGIVWTVMYLLSLEVWPQGIRGIEYQDWQDNFAVTAYFSYVTMTTLGYGDLIPVIPFTRTLAYLQAVTGTFYLAIIVARLVAAFAHRTK